MSINHKRQLRGLTDMQRELDGSVRRWTPLHSADTMDDSPVDIQRDHYRDLARVYYNLYLRASDSCRELADGTTARSFDWAINAGVNNIDYSRRFFIMGAMVVCARCGGRFVCGTSSSQYIFVPHCDDCDQREHRGTLPTRQ